jgi:TRAP-type transport system small permease protein
MKPAIERIQSLISVFLVTMLFCMVALTFVDVIGRRVFNAPVYGAHDITEHLMAVIVFTGLPLLTYRRGHLAIDLFDSWLLRPQMQLWHRVIDLCIFGVLALVAVEYHLAALEATKISAVSQALGIPRTLMYHFISFMSGLASLVALLAVRPHHDAPGVGASDG